MNPLQWQVEFSQEGALRLKKYVWLFIINHSEENSKNLDQAVSRPQSKEAWLLENIWSFMTIKLLHYWKWKNYRKNTHNPFTETELQ